MCTLEQIFTAEQRDERSSRCGRRKSRGHASPHVDVAKRARTVCDSHFAAVLKKEEGNTHSATPSKLVVDVVKKHCAA